MLKPNLALKIILVIAIAGILFSGYLSYQELFTEECELGCSVVADEGKLLGVPVCVYGFLMYSIIFGISTLGLIRKRKK